jgi:hypothetical protein
MMELKINIEKKHFYILAALIVIIGAMTIVIATAPAGAIQSHGQLYTDIITGKTADIVTVQGKTRLQLDCRQVAGSYTQPNTMFISAALCNSDEFALTGESHCLVAGGFLASAGAIISNGQPVGWIADCYRHDNGGEMDSVATAVCCKKY